MKIGIFDVLNLFLNFILFLSSYCVGKNKKLVLLGSDNGIRFRGNTKYIYFELINHSTYFNPYWITKSRELYIHFKNKSLPVLYLYSISAFIKIIKAQYLILETYGKDVSYAHILLGKFNIIQTMHGIPLKQVAIDELKFKIYKDKENISIIKRIYYYLLIRELRSYKVIISTSKICSELFSRAFLSKNVKIFGFPRNDIFFYNKKNSHEQTFTLSPSEQYKTVIVYAPTFRDKAVSARTFTEPFLFELNEYLIQNRCLFIIKKHPLDKKLKLPQKYSNITDTYVDIDDIQELFVATDILITDYSGIFFDFVLTNKPIIFYPYDIDEYLLSCREMYFSYFDELPGPFAKNEQELFNLLKTIKMWFNNSEYQAAYKCFKDKFHEYQDGESSKRLVEYLYNILD